jgi:hypothetical protein
MGGGEVEGNWQRCGMRWGAGRDAASRARGGGACGGHFTKARTYFVVKYLDRDLWKGGRRGAGRRWLEVRGGRWGEGIGGYAPRMRVVRRRLGRMYREEQVGMLFGRA